MERLTSGGLFTLTHMEEMRWSIELRADQVHDLFTSFSDWGAAEVGEAARAVDELGGRVAQHYLTRVFHERSRVVTV